MENIITWANNYKLQIFKNSFYWFTDKAVANILCKIYLANGTIYRVLVLFSFGTVLRNYKVYPLENIT